MMVYSSNQMWYDIGINARYRQVLFLFSPIIKDDILTKENEVHLCPQYAILW